MQAPVMSAVTGRRLVVRDALELNLNCCQQAALALIEPLTERLGHPVVWSATRKLDARHDNFPLARDSGGVDAFCLAPRNKMAGSPGILWQGLIVNGQTVRSGRTLRCEVKVEGYAGCNHAKLRQRILNVRAK
jgi:hypothetical protein